MMFHFLTFGANIRREGDTYSFSPVFPDDLGSEYRLPKPQPSSIFEWLGNTSKSLHVVRTDVGTEFAKELILQKYPTRKDLVWDILQDPKNAAGLKWQDINLFFSDKELGEEKVTFPFSPNMMEILFDKTTKRIEIPGINLLYVEFSVVESLVSPIHALKTNNCPFLERVEGIPNTHWLFKCPNLKSASASTTINATACEALESISIKESSLEYSSVSITAVNCPSLKTIFIERGSEISLSIYTKGCKQLSGISIPQGLQGISFADDPENPELLPKLQKDLKKQGFSGRVTISGKEVQL